MTEKIVLSVDRDEFATILAALRWYQESGMGYGPDRPNWLDDIATDGGTLVGLDTDDIDVLVLDLNCEGES